MKRFQVIYLITNLINNKIYIGKHITDDLNDNYFGSGTVIKQAIKKYGLENFTKTYLLVKTDLTKEELNSYERYYINLYKSKENGYNLTDGGDGGRTSGTFVKGHKDSEETKRKKSESHKGLLKGPMSETTKLKQSLAHKGKKMSEETKNKISLAGKGKKMSEETCKNISNSLKGKPKSEEHKLKISNSLKKIKNNICL